MIRRAGAVGATLLASTFLMSACGESADSTPVPIFNVQLGPGFTISPAELTVPAGPFEVVVTNQDPQLPHSLVTLTRSTARLAPGQSQRLIIKRGHEPEVGDYRMFCDVPGHQQQGQVGVVHVVTATAASTSGVTAP